MLHAVWMQVTSKFRPLVVMSDLFIQYRFPGPYTDTSILHACYLCVCVCVQTTGVCMLVHPIRTMKLIVLNLKHSLFRDSVNPNHC